MAFHNSHSILWTLKRKPKKRTKQHKRREREEKEKFGLVSFIVIYMERKIIRIIIISLRVFWHFSSLLPLLFLHLVLSSSHIRVYSVRTMAKIVIVRRLFHLAFVVAAFSTCSTTTTSRLSPSPFLLLCCCPLIDNTSYYSNLPSK